MMRGVYMGGDLESLSVHDDTRTNIYGERQWPPGDNPQLDASIGARNKDRWEQARCCTQARLILASY